MALTGKKVLVKIGQEGQEHYYDMSAQVSNVSIDSPIRVEEIFAGDRYLPPPLTEVNLTLHGNVSTILGELEDNPIYPCTWCGQYKVIGHPCPKCGAPDELYGEG